ncbi:MAG: type VI secretion system tip protein VgrG [Desulfobacterales bacterium]|nr:type VI secretion system tip protein VgrG [Desulfobacterales bacterium]
MTSSAVHFDFEIAGFETQFRVLSFSSTEGLSQLFRYDLFVTAETSDIDLSRIIGLPATLAISTGDDTRWLSGMVSRFWWVGESGDLSAYYAEVVPVQWLLWHRYDCRIFQNLSVPQIVSRVLEEANIAADSLDTKLLRKNHALREYCVQYQESDFNFVARLMEEEGIFYFFRHQYDPKNRRGRHVMVLGDDPSCHATISGKSTVIFNEPSGQVPSEEYVYEFQFGHQTRPGRVALCDYNYLRPDLDLKVEAGARDFAHLGIYHYPGSYDTQPAGNVQARLRLEEMQALTRLGMGRSVCCRFLPGYFFKLKDHPQKKLSQEYLLYSVSQNGAQRDVSSESQSGDLEKILEQLMGYIPLPSIGPFSVQQIFDNLKKGLDYLFGKEKEYYYGNQFHCLPLATPFRPARLTPKPFVRGPQTAKVVATGQEKAQMDELGRVKVKFHWDRAPQADDFKRTCFIRMAYSYAGGKHGIQFPPLAGDEVVVDFIDGDPDKPLITGAVYNGLNRPPLKPEEKIENIILTPSQHRLHFSDREAAVTLNTGGGETLLMKDGEEHTDLGRHIQLQTADEHSLTLAKGAKVSGIKLETQKGQKIVLWDEPHPDGILLEDRTGLLSLQLNSQDTLILLKNKSDQQIVIDCRSGGVTIQGGGVEVVGGQVNVNGSSEVKITSGGKVAIEAPSIEATGAGSIKLSAPDITLEGAQINLNAPLVSAISYLKAGSMLQVPVVNATAAVVSPSYSPGVGNLT